MRYRDRKIFIDLESLPGYVCDRLSGPIDCYRTTCYFLARRHRRRPLRILLRPRQQPPRLLTLTRSTYTNIPWVHSRRARIDAGCPTPWSGAARGCSCRSRCTSGASTPHAGAWAPAWVLVSAGPFCSGRAKCARGTARAHNLACRCRSSWRPSRGSSHQAADPWKKAPARLMNLSMPRVLHVSAGGFHCEQSIITWTYLFFSCSGRGTCGGEKRKGRQAPGGAARP